MSAWSWGGGSAHGARTEERAHGTEVAAGLHVPFRTRDLRRQADCRRSPRVAKAGFGNRVVTCGGGTAPVGLPDAFGLAPARPPCRLEFMADATSPVHELLVRHLTAAGVSFRQVHHAPTPTSADAARALGEPIGCGAKALVLKTDDRFRLFVLPADRKLDSAAVKRHLALGRLRFASPQELLELTGLVPGSVPPFGEPILPFELLADVALGTVYPHVAFNAGSLTDSIIMAAADWERVAHPVRLPLSAAAS
jgi:Ala-tRNA(Pro) deacylase